MGTVYSYQRVSSGQQVTGSGLERQEEAVAAWASGAGHELDTTLDLSDRGRSAYKSRHIQGGALGRFLELAQAGQLRPDPVLAVEAIDRLTRSTPVEGLQRILLALVDAGVAIYSVEDAALYSKETLSDGPGPLVMLVLRAGAAHDYSKRLGTRVAAAHERLRQRIAAGEKPKVNNTPWWIDWTGEEYRLNDRAALVERMFDYSEQGWGGGRIAGQFNEEGLLNSRGGAWSAVAINSTMGRASCCGTLELKTGPVPGFYPAVVSEERWRAATHRRTAVNTQRGGFAAATQFWFIGQGLARCRHCKRTVGVHSGTGKGTKRLYYVRCQTPGCVKGGWPLTDATLHLLDRLQPESLATLAGAPIDTTAADRAVADAQVELDLAASRLQAARDKATEAALSPDTPLATVTLLATAMEAAEKAVGGAEKRLGEARAARMALVPVAPNVDLSWLNEQTDFIEDPEDRRRINETLGRMGLRIEVDRATNEWGMAIGQRPLQWAPFDARHLPKVSG